jgi:hypothetical protein
VVTPDLADRFGTLTNDPGLPYVVATDRVNLVGPIVAVRPGQTLRRITKHPWRLREASYGVSDDGWISGSGEGTPATGTYAYFGPERTLGTLTVGISRAGFCAATAPKTHVTVRVGPVALNEQRAPVVLRPTRIAHLVLPNCKSRALRFAAVPPVAAVVTADPTVRPSDYGGSDTRDLGVQVGFSFTPKR